MVGIQLYVCLLSVCEGHPVICMSDYLSVKVICLFDCLAVMVIQPSFCLTACLWWSCSHLSVRLPVCHGHAAICLSDCCVSWSCSHLSVCHGHAAICLSGGKKVWGREKCGIGVSCARGLLIIGMSSFVISLVLHYMLYQRRVLQPQTTHKIPKKGITTTNHIPYIIPKKGIATTNHT